MQLVEPIRDLNDIERIKNYLIRWWFRDFLMFIMGINIGLRISDLLSLKVKDVMNGDYVELKERKTGKYKRFPLSDSYKWYLREYTVGMDPEEWLFQSQRGVNQRLTRIQAYRIFNRACEKLEIKINIGTHTLRKTFGYHFYKRTKDIALLQRIFNHSTPAVTLRYIGISQEIIDESLLAFNLWFYKTRFVT